MLIEILGTGGAEGLPALFCDCATCQRMRRLGGKNIRTRSGTRIDGILQLDFPPDFFFQCLHGNYDTARLRHILITHSHYDHCALGDLGWIGPKFACRPGLPPVTVHSNADVIQLLEAQNIDPACLTPAVVGPGDRFQVGEYEITATRASHSIDQDPLNFLVAKDGKGILYACDTGRYADTAWLPFQNAATNAVIIECTYGYKEPPHIRQHLDLRGVLEFKVLAEGCGAVSPDAKWILTHFSHVCEASHEELEERCGAYGFIVGYDGLQITL